MLLVAPVLGKHRSRDQHEHQTAGDPGSGFYSRLHFVPGKPLLQLRRRNWARLTRYYLRIRVDILLDLQIIQQA